MIEQQLIDLLRTKAHYEAIRLPDNFLEKLGMNPNMLKAHNIFYTYWTPSGDEAMMGWFNRANDGTISSGERDGDFTAFLDLIKLNSDLHKHKLGSSDEEAENILLLIKDAKSWSPYIIKCIDFYELIRYQTAYITVYASDQFANDVDLHWSRREAVENAKDYVNKQGWMTGYIEDVNEIEHEYPDDVASITHSVLIYHAQEEEDRCEEYVSVFEVLAKR